MSEFFEDLILIIIFSQKEGFPFKVSYSFAV